LRSLSPRLRTDTGDGGVSPHFSLKNRKGRHFVA
jgi:hypothetical protein